MAGLCDTRQVWAAGGWPEMSIYTSAHAACKVVYERDSTVAVLAHKGEVFFLFPSWQPLVTHFKGKNMSLFLYTIAFHPSANP